MISSRALMSHVLAQLQTRSVNGCRWNADATSSAFALISSGVATFPRKACTLPSSSRMEASCLASSSSFWLASVLRGFGVVPAPAVGVGDNHGVEPAPAGVGDEPVHLLLLVAGRAVLLAAVPLDDAAAEPLHVLVVLCPLGP